MFKGSRIHQPMQVPNSPLFPASQLTLSPAVNSAAGTVDDALIPTLPDEPLVKTGTIEVYIVPSEKCLFVQGFDTHEYDSRPPALLRGSLFVRILKPGKIRSIQLLLKGFQRTDWPEGIPPKKTIYAEINDVVSHTWPFYQMGQPGVNNGADFFRDLNESKFTVSLSPLISVTESVSSLSISNNFFTRGLSPSFLKKSTSNDSLSGLDEPGYFAPGDYIYNFEHPLQASVPETCLVTFGSVNYHLEVNIARLGAFKSNITAKYPIEVVRTPSFLDTEENEPIIINRQWEDQLKYDIVIGAKSVVLNSYLPLAIRFVPLFGKVKVHRIRVYILENIEYYCQNKKVHRLEPPHKYLLLEHKASKGNSLLAKDPLRDISNDTPIADDENNDDILNKELEFQLFIPSKLQKPGAEIHPDTSFDNIQVHHWIKICLRISKTDPENPEKRKHYEISIDSPIHILSPLAAHGNTLLPVYDDLIDLPDYSFATPPVSPGVIPVDMDRLIGQSAASRSRSNTFGRHTRGNSIHSNVPSVEPVFRHIATSTGNEEPFDREADMHLDANLYKPDPEDLNPLLHSPQATPYSPMVTPISRPIHLIRKPSVNPPPFVAGDAPPPIANTLPPAYEEEFSMSPLRINDVEDDNDNLPLSFGNNETIPIQELLRMRLHAASPAEQRTISSLTENESPRVLKQEIPVVSHNYPLPTFQFNNQSPPHEEADPGVDIQEVGPHEEGAQEVQTQEVEETIDESDIADFPSPLQGPTSTSPIMRSRRGSMSRRSSISSIGSDFNGELDQTLPLLTMSTSSFAPTQSNDLRNASVGSLLFDPSRRLTSTKIMDLGDSSEYSVQNNLANIRNPRLRKQQSQEHEDMGLNEGSLNLDSASIDQASGRQKSFGVIQSFDDNSSGELRIDADREARQELAGFNRNYVL